MKKITCTLLLIITLSGCASVQSWKYTSEQPIYQKPQTNITISVSPLRDERKNKNGAKASALLSLIPLVPYSVLDEYNVPEASPFLKFKPTEDFPKSAAEELKNTALFKDVYFSEKTSDADFQLVGTLKKSRIKGKWTLYGLSLPGDLLWVLGAPIGKTHNDIAIEYKLIDKNYKVHFTKLYFQNIKFNNYYWTNPHEKFRFEEAIKKINLELIHDIKDILPQLSKK